MGLASFNGAMALRSYVEGNQYSEEDKKYFAMFKSCPDPQMQPHAYRWYKHIAALQGTCGQNMSAPVSK